MFIECTHQASTKGKGGSLENDDTAQLSSDHKRIVRGGGPIRGGGVGLGGWSHQT